MSDQISLLSLSLFFSVLCVSCHLPSETPAPTILDSPKGKNRVAVFVNDIGQLGYKIFHHETMVIDTSWLAFDLKDAPKIERALSIADATIKSVTETWEMPWGEQRKVQNNYNQLTVNVEEQKEPYRKFSLIFRAYDDGIAFRYHFPKQEALSEVILLDELTQFKLTGDHEVWWTPGDWDIYEHLYNQTRFTQIDAISKRDHPNLAQTYIPENAVNTPVTMKMENGIHLSFHEANLTDYAGMTLKVDPSRLLMESELVGSDITGYKVKRSTPFNTPWRTIQIADRAGDLIDSNLIINLNEPNKIGDVSWFKPTKYVGIWWEMHLGKSTWDMASGKHGANTENAKRYIDFAAANQIGAVLVEGWNTGWERWIGFEDREGVFDFVTAYPDYDLEEVVKYGKGKGVNIIMHHETSAAPRTYEQQLDSAYKLMERLGIHAVKTGYVGKTIPKGEYHHGQWMVNHYRKVLEKAAEHQVAVNAHEPIKDTGIRRTYPNAISREGLRGQEFNAWASDGGNPPSHLPTVAFTRMLAGPIDYTPGIFNIKLKPYKEKNQVNTTLAQQLALYVVIYSPVQMAADLPEYYEGNEAFQFIRDVAVDWEESKVLNGEVGQYVTIARREKNSDNWFIGAITNEEPREFTIDLTFLDNGKNYKATIYEDASNAHWNKNPTAYKIRQVNVNSESKLQLQLAPGGGTAISLVPAK